MKHLHDKTNLYAGYIKRYLARNKPENWKDDMFGKFPGSLAGVRDYFNDILETTEDSVKKNAIVKKYRLKSYMPSVDRDKARSVYDFLVGRTSPHSKSLEFIALVFDVPVISLDDFVVNYDEIKKQEEQELLLEERKRKLALEKERLAKEAEQIKKAQEIITLEEEQNQVLKLRQELEEANKDTDKEQQKKETQYLQEFKEELTKDLTQKLKQELQQEPEQEPEPQSQPPLSPSPDIIRKKKQFVKISVLACIAFFIFSITSFFLIGSPMWLITGEEQHKEKIVRSSVMPVYIGDKFFNGDLIKVNLNPPDTGLIYQTTGIRNDHCLTEKNPWSFRNSLDSLGEDMKNPNFGGCLSKDIRTHHAQLNGSINIANKYMDLSFLIKNAKQEDMRLQTVMLRVVQRHNANAENYNYNLYESREFPLERLHITLTKSKIFPFTTTPRRLARGEEQHFMCRIEGNEECDNWIYEFEIVAEFIDGRGKRHVVKSDKHYFLGFVRN